jgi:hypothetical protein
LCISLRKTADTIFWLLFIVLFLFYGYNLKR